MRRSGIGRRESPLADELDLIIGDDLEAVPLALAVGAMLDRPKTDASLQARDEESLAIIDLLPPVEAAISLVEHVGCASMDRDLTADLDVIDVRRRHLDALRDIALWIVNHVQLHAADATVPGRPATNLAEGDRTGVDQAHHLLAFAPQLPACHCR